MRKTWTKADEKALIDLYPTAPIETLTARFKCSKGAVSKKAFTLGLRAKNKVKKEKIYQSYIVRLLRYDNAIKFQRTFEGRNGKFDKKSLIKRWNEKYDRFLKAGFYYISITHNLECYA